MTFTAFFSEIPPIPLFDPLAAVLGAAEGGRIDYRYEDAVRLAGHSCPTVAGAWLLAKHALAALYPEGLPQRGGIQVELRDAQNAGSSGVVGAVLGLITGAAGEGGFAGLGGRFSRRGLLHFGVAIAAEVRFTRLDTGATVSLDYDPKVIPPTPEMQALMQKVMSGTADAEERGEFGRLWQERVRRIVFADVPGLVTRHPA